MNERSAGFLLQFAVTIHLVTAQIHFPDDRYYRSAQNFATNVPTEDLVADLTTIQRVVSTPKQQNPFTVIADGITKLTLDINRIVPTTAPHLAQADNIVYGPITIAGALCMVLLASIGQTFDEVANLLGLTRLNIHNNPTYVQEQIGQLFSRLESQTGQRVSFATAIFVQKNFPIRPAFHEASAALYQSNLMNLDFKNNPGMAQNVINTWVSGRTNGKIPTLLDDPPPPSTQAIIASVLYFQAAWEYPFFDGHTKWRPFYVNGRKSRSDRMAEMMSNGAEFPYYKDTSLGVEIMGFPYKGKRTTMYVILPMESNKEKLRRLENSLTPADIDHLVNSTRITEAVVLFPKMKLETTMSLKNTLQKLGVNSLFNPRQANLALLSPGVSQNFNAPEAPFVSPPINQPSINIQSPPRISQEDFEDRLIFTRFGDSSNNCTLVFDPIINGTRCKNAADARRPSGNVRAVPMPLSARDASPTATDQLDSLRRQLNFNPQAANPGLYADQVIHKVYIDITESGTEAASVTGVSLNRSGGRVTFRVDMPFLFFIYHEETKLILFWGSVKSPTPTIPTR